MIISTKAQLNRPDLICYHCHNDVVPMGYLHEGEFKEIPKQYYCPFCQESIGWKMVGARLVCDQCKKPHIIKLFDMGIHKGLCSDCNKEIKKKTFFDRVRDMTPDQIKRKLEKAGFSAEDIEEMFKKFKLA